MKLISITATGSGNEHYKEYMLKFSNGNYGEVLMCELVAKELALSVGIEVTTH